MSWEYYGYLFTWIHGNWKNKLSNFKFMDAKLCLLLNLLTVLPVDNLHRVVTSIPSRKSWTLPKFLCQSVNSWYSFYRPRKDERLSGPWSHPVVLNTGHLDWKSNTLTSGRRTSTFFCIHTHYVCCLSHFKLSEFFLLFKQFFFACGRLFKFCSSFVSKLYRRSSLHKLMWCLL